MFERITDGAESLLLYDAWDWFDWLSTNQDTQISRRLYYNVRFNFDEFIPTSRIAFTNVACMSMYTAVFRKEQFFFGGDFHLV